MADLPYIQQAQEIKIIGQDSVGDTVNYVSADANGNLAVKDYANGPASPGTAAPSAILIAGLYNSTLPTLTTGQQAALQSDSSGRLLTNGSGVTQPISAASLPLPAGAATSALQTTINTSLTTINTTLGSPMQQTGGSVSVTATAAPTDITASGTLTGTSSQVILNLNGQASLNIDVSGTWVGAIAVTEPGISVSRQLYVQLQSSSALAGTITTNGNYRVVGLSTSSQVIVTFTSYTSGTATIGLRASSAPFYVQPYQLNAANLLTSSWLSDGTGNPLSSTSGALNVSAVGAAANGAAVSGNPVLVGASDGTNAQTLRVNPVNNGVETLLTQNNENLRQTYSILLSNFPVATASTDVFILNGSATKTIRVTHIEFSMTTTTAVVVPVTLVKRSTANTGGVTGSATITPHDSNNATATATNLAYATPGTVGTIVGTGIRSVKYFSQVATPTTPAEQIIWDLGTQNNQPIVLRGVAQGLAINLGGTALAGATISCSITWTEDNS